MTSTSTVSAASFTCFHVVCRLRPEYVDFVRELIDHGDWPALNPGDVGHDAVRDWLQFQRENGHAMIHLDKNNYRGVIFKPEKHESFMDGGSAGAADIFYRNSPPFGLYSPRWGQKCELRIYYEDDDENEIEEDEYCDIKEQDKSRIWWEFAGQTANKDGEIDYFVRHVVGVLSDEIFVYNVSQTNE